MCESLSNNGNTHTVCKTKFSPISILAMFKHTKTAKNIINRSKGHPYAYRNIAKLLKIPHAKNIIEKALIDVDLIVPIPQSSNIFTKRLENLPLIIAKEAAQTQEIPTYTMLKHSHFNNKLQKTLQREKRLKNARNSIKIDKKQIRKIKGKHILLIDDTTVTGATLIYASELLIRNGAKSVKCLAITKDILER